MIQNTKDELIEEMEVLNFQCKNYVNKKKIFLSIMQLHL